MNRVRIKPQGTLPDYDEPARVQTTTSGELTLQITASAPGDFLVITTGKSEAEGSDNVLITATGEAQDTLSEANDQSDAEPDTDRSEISGESSTQSDGAQSQSNNSGGSQSDTGGIGEALEDTATDLWEVIFG